MIAENSVVLDIAFPPKDVHKKMEVFYNPVMASHRNIAILLLNSVPNALMNIADPLAGSGIRSLRFAKELATGKINHLFVNDVKENFPEVFRENARRNGVSLKNITLSDEDASLFLLNQVKEKFKPKKFCGYFDYIDIDPFGSPNPFLDAALARITRKGILAVTATDTAALTGTYEKVTRRKYWAQPLRNYLMHEIGLRILIRKVQLQGIQFDKALLPVLSYSKDHYYRIYFRADRGKEKCDKILKQHNYFLFCRHCLNFTASIFNRQKCGCGKEFAFAGPLWAGNLGETALVHRMLQRNPFPEEQKLLGLLHDEYRKNTVGFYDLHVLAKKYRRDTPKIEPIMRRIKGARTHFSGTGIKTAASRQEIVGLMKKLNRQKMH